MQYTEYRTYSLLYKIYFRKTREKNFSDFFPILPKSLMNFAEILKYVLIFLCKLTWRLN